MAKNTNSKMMLAATDIQAVVDATHSATAEYLEEGKPGNNVVGVGAGVKWKNGEPTGEPAVLVLVTHKVAKDQLSKRELVPPDCARHANRRAGGRRCHGW